MSFLGRDKPTLVEEASGGNNSVARYSYVVEFTQTNYASV